MINIKSNIKKIATLATAAALLALAADSRAQTGTSGYPTSIPAATPAAPVTQIRLYSTTEYAKFIEAEGPKMDTPNLKAYHVAGLFLIVRMNDSAFAHSGAHPDVVQPPTYAEIMELCWDGMDKKEREQGKKYNA